MRPTAAQSDVIAFPLRRLATDSCAPPYRPRLLVQAAQAGQPAWRRARDLPRAMRGAWSGWEGGALSRPGAALDWLRAEEARLDDARRAGAAEYDLARHVTLLIALLHEMTHANAADRAALALAL